MQKQILFLVLLLIGFKNVAQKPCLSNQQINERIIQIKTDTKLSNQDKINQYFAIEKAYFSCKTTHDTIKAKLYTNIGINYYSLNETSKTFQFTHKSYDILLKYQSTKPLILYQTSYNLGYYYYANFSFQKSNDYFLKAVNFTNDKTKQVYCIQTVATTTYEFGDFEKSNEYINQALAIAGNDDIYSLTNLYNQKSNNYRSLEQFDKSFENIKIAENLYKKWSLKSKNNDFFLEGVIQTNLGLDYYRNKDYLSAIEYQKKCGISFKKADRYDKVIENSLLNIGYLQSLIGKKDNAIQTYDEAIKLIKEKFDTTKNPFFARIHGNKAYVLFEQKKYDLSTIEFRKAFERFPIFDIKRNNYSQKALRVIKDKGILQDILTDYADCLIAKGIEAKNKKYLSEALKVVSMADKIIDVMRFEHIGFQTELYWRNKTRSLYENAIETCFLLNQPEDAFYFFEKSRAVLLNDKLKELGAKQLLSESDLKKETELQQKLDELRKLVFEKNTDTNQRNLLTAETNQTNFIRQLETRNPAYYQYKYDTTTLKTAEVRAKILKKKQTLVEYFVGKDAVYAFVLTPSQANVYQIKDNTFSKTSSLLMGMMANEDSLNKNFAKYLNISNQFYKKFIETLHIPKGRVVVSSDGIIIPFSALSYSATMPQWLLNDYIFSNTYSAKFLSKENPKSSFQTKSFLGIAPVNFANNSIKLTNSDASLQRIAKQFSSPKLLLNKEANKHSFMSQIADYQVIQLYTHALANDTLSQLYFSDSTLKASELTSNRLVPTQLVVLSACQTGIGKDAKGEGVFSLARSFATLGIPSMLTTLWQVDNESTYELTELFYKYLKQGLPKDEALNKAQKEYLSANQSSRNLPNYWAGMVLIGDNSTIDSDYLYVWVLLSIILIGIVGFWYWRKKRSATI